LQGDRSDLLGGGLHRSLRGWQSIDRITRGRERWASDERILGSSDFVLKTLAELPVTSISSPDEETIERLLHNVAQPRSARFAPTSPDSDVQASDTLYP